MFKKLKDNCVGLIYDYIYCPLYFNFVYFRDLKRIEKHYKGFEKINRLKIKKNTFVYNPKNPIVCRQLLAEISKIVDDLEIQPKLILFDGDNKSVKIPFKERFGFHSAEVLTVGIEGDFDYNWNFENDPPIDLPKNFDLIVSQAMLEHLLNPYKHFSDLVDRLAKGGLIVIHSEMPGYTYHRYPIDAVRFFPDWFEVSAERLNLHIVRKFRRDFSLIYLFRKI